MGGRRERCREGAASLLKRFVSNLWAVKMLSPEEPFKLSVSSSNPSGRSAGCWGPPRFFFLPRWPPSSFVQPSGPSAIVDDFFFCLAIQTELHRWRGEYQSDFFWSVFQT